MKSKVYFTNMRTTYDNNMLEKLERLLISSGFKNIDFKGKFVALKIHFGEFGNLAFVKPNYVKVIADLIKELGGIPFLTDASTLYSGKRSDAVSHINVAELNGFNSVTTGCPVIIADGLKGNDYKEINVGLKHCSTVKIGTSLTEADIIISINHFKGHEQAGFGGALKNLGMGCGSKLGKLEMHSGLKPIINKDTCIACGLCVKNCNQKAISVIDKAEIDYNKCVGCGECIVVCPKKAITQKESSESKLLNEKIVEYAYGVLKDKKHFHINFIMNVSPNCDCWSNNDLQIVPDIGIMSSFDPVALDIASADLVNNAPVVKGSVLDEKEALNTDKFKCMHGNVDWMSGIIYAEELKIGSKEYEIINVEK